MNKKQIVELKDTDISKGITLDKYSDERIYNKRNNKMNLKKALELRKAKFISKKRGKSGEWKYKYKEERERLKIMAEQVPLISNFTKDKVIAVSTIDKNVKYYNINGTVWRITSTGAKVNEGDIKDFSRKLKEGKHYRAKEVKGEINA